MTPPATQWITLTREELDLLEQYTRAAAQEPWTIGHSGTETTEAAIDWMKTSIEQRPDPDLWLTLIDKGPDDTQLIAVTGNGPRSRAHAEYLIMVQPHNMLRLLLLLRKMIGTTLQIAVPVEPKEQPPVCTQ